MSVQEPLRIRKALLVGAVALALTGTGVAIAWSATDTASTSASDSAPGKSGQAKADKPGKEAKPDKAQRPQRLHSESVVKKADGTFETELSQHGTVEAVNETSVTVKSEDGFTQTYVVDASTKIVQVPARAADGAPPTGDDGKRLKPSDGTIADITTGDVVRVSGVKSGDSVTAGRIVEGAGDGPGLGLGKGMGKGHGKGPGQLG